MTELHPKCVIIESGMRMTVICSYFNSTWSINKVDMFPQQLVYFDVLETITGK